MCLLARSAIKAPSRGSTWNALRLMVYLQAANIRTAVELPPTVAATNIAKHRQNHTVMTPKRQSLTPLISLCVSSICRDTIHTSCGVNLTCYKPGGLLFWQTHSFVNSCILSVHDRCNRKTIGQVKKHME